MTNHWIDWEKFNNEMKNIIKPVFVYKDSRSDYRKKLITLSSYIKDILSKRFDLSKKENKIEKIVKLPHEIIKSRLQRRLDSFRYDSGKTRYEFNETKKIPLGNSTKIKTILKTYPEENKTTSIVVSLKYTSVFDTFRNRDVFGKKEAKKYLLNQLKLINKVILR